VNLGWRAWLAMGLLCELSLWLGWKLGGPTRGTRQVVALGTSNRNIALALLVALESFPGTPVVSAVVGNGLLLIALGLLHVAWWRFGGAGRRAA
jgi:BASS family bile acid:Na+ symporter